MASRSFLFHQGGHWLITVLSSCNQLIVYSYYVILLQHEDPALAAFPDARELLFEGHSIARQTGLNGDYGAGGICGCNHNVAHARGHRNHDGIIYF